MHWWPTPGVLFNPENRQAMERGEDVGGFQQFCFPVIKYPDPNNPGQVLRKHILLFQDIQSGGLPIWANNTFMLALLETITGNTPLAPKDWQMLTRASLNRGDYLLWKSEFADQCQQQAE